MPLVDAYRCGDQIVLWYKSKTSWRVVVNYTHHIYADRQAEAFLQNTPYQITTRKTYMHDRITVCKIPFRQLSQIQRWIKRFEQLTQYRIGLYNADIKPEQMYLYEHNLTPFDGEHIHLSAMHIECITAHDIRINPNTAITAIRINDEIISGDNLLETFVNRFITLDPDVLLVTNGYRMLPFLESYLTANRLSCPFHRWDSNPLCYQGGKTYYSYGAVRYQDHPIKLHGRLLIDICTTIGSQCDIEGIIELCTLSGQRFQDIVSRSYGAVFQHALVKTMVRDGCIVPYKQKPIDTPLTMAEMVKSDRVGHTFDPRIGLHHNVAEIDFCSMFAHLMYNYNISAETLLNNQSPFQRVPGIPVKISLTHQGYIAQAIKPFIDQRMYYKRHPTTINKQRAAGLKWVLVSSYGYLRFREFKLGIPSSHMAIGAFAREILLSTAKLCEHNGFTVIHGIIDSLYITKKGMTHRDVKELCTQIEQYSGIPLSFEGIFEWIVFLPSINDDQRPLPSRYYGKLECGDFKVRGVEMRQRNIPLVVKYFQQKVLEHIDSGLDLVYICGELKHLIANLKKTDKRLLTCSITLRKEHYNRSCLQRQVADMLRNNGQSVKAGQPVSFIVCLTGVCHPDHYRGNVNITYYKNLLIRSLFILVQPFDIHKEQIEQLVEGYTQKTIDDYYTCVPFRYIPIPSAYKNRKGLSERYVKRMLQRQGWEVWRGGGFNLTNSDYPVVIRKYQRLHHLMETHCPTLLERVRYMCHVHHGMPDFVCFRNGQFKFVECKLGYEQLSSRQKVSIENLQQLGFEVEVIKVVDSSTKIRKALVNITTNTKMVQERQLTMRVQW